MQRHNHHGNHHLLPLVTGDDVYTYRSREGEIMEYNAELNKTAIIMNNSTFVSTKYYRK